MRTVFVNPGSSLALRKGKRRRKATRRRVGRPRARAAAPKRRRRRRSVRTVAVLRPRRKYKLQLRRNAGIAPFIQNPSYPMVNPRRRRARRRNPLAQLMSPRTVISKALTLGGGSMVGAGANILVVRKIENMYLRNGARAALAVLAGTVFKGEMGAAMAGSILYPLWAEVALLSKLIPEGGHQVLGADLSADLSADLDDVLGSDEDLFA